MKKITALIVAIACFSMISGAAAFVLDFKYDIPPLPDSFIFYGNDRPLTSPVIPPPSPSLNDVFFDKDESKIRDDIKSLLDKNIKIFKINSRMEIVIEGHTDARGTAEYNLRLGELRANAIKEYLVDGGIENERIYTISYGKERPFVLGLDESAYKWNRRAHFLIRLRRY